MLERRRNRFKRERFLKNRPVGQISADLSVKLIRIDRSFWAGFVGQIEADLAVILERIGHNTATSASVGPPLCNCQPDWGWPERIL